MLGSAVRSCRVGAVANYTNAFAVESYERPTVDAQEAATRLVVPSCSCTSEHALAPSLARKFLPP